MKKIRFTVLIAALTVSLCAQKRAVPLTESHSRVLAIDTTTRGKDGILKPTHAAGMIGMVCVYSKDSQHALCEFVAKDRKDHDALFAAASLNADSKMLAVEKASADKKAFTIAAHAAGFTNFDLRKFSVGVK